MLAKFDSGIAMIQIPDLMKTKILDLIQKDVYTKCTTNTSK